MLEGIKPTEKVFKPDFPLHVLLDKKRAYLPEYSSEYPGFRDFMALDYRQVQITWGLQGWHKKLETANCILLTRDR